MNLKDCFPQLCMPHERLIWFIIALLLSVKYFIIGDIKFRSRWNHPVSVNNVCNTYEAVRHADISNI